MLAGHGGSAEKTLAQVPARAATFGAAMAHPSDDKPFPAERKTRKVVSSLNSVSPIVSQKAITFSRNETWWFLGGAFVSLIALIPLLVLFLIGMTRILSMPSNERTMDDISMQLQNLMSDMSSSCRPNDDQEDQEI